MGEILEQEKELVKTKETSMKYGFKLISHQYWFINCNKYTILIQDVSDREISFWAYRKSLYHLSNLSVNLKLF